MAGSVPPEADTTTLLAIEHQALLEENVTSRLNATTFSNEHEWGCVHTEWGRSGHFGIYWCHRCGMIRRIHIPEFVGLNHREQERETAYHSARRDLFLSPGKEPSWHKLGEMPTCPGKPEHQGVTIDTWIRIATLVVWMSIVAIILLGRFV